MKSESNEKSPNSPHSHRFTIADDEAVETLMRKLEKSGFDRQNRSKLQQSLETAMQEYNGTSDAERKAFFHGMLTGYGVALKLEQRLPKSA